MRLGLSLNAQDGDVQRLHQILIAAGLEIDPDELADGLFGASTLGALHVCQRQHDLPETNEIDEVTLILLQGLEETINITINEGSGTTPPPPTGDRRGVVRGKLVDQDGGPIPHIKADLFSVQVRREVRIREATTDRGGRFVFTYERPRPLNLVVRAFNEAGTVIAESKPLFKAAAHAEIDITTAKDRVVRAPSQFTTLVASVTAALHDTNLLDLVQNQDKHELSFLANEIAVEFDQVAYLYIAESLARKNGLRSETLFGLFISGTPPTLKSALGNLPDAGIDDAFVAQVFSAVLNVATGVLAKTLTASVAANVLPASYADLQAAELARIDSLRVSAVASTPYIRGKTPLNDLLSAGAVAANVHTAFVQAYAASVGHLGPTWKTLRADKSLSKQDLATLNTVLSAGELLTGNLPLVKDTLQQLSRGSLASLRDLALLDEADWEARISTVDPGATSIPQVLPGDTAADRIARFAKALAQRFAGRYPTTAFRGGLTKATASSFRTRAELVSFLGVNPTFNFRRYQHRPVRRHEAAPDLARNARRAEDGAAPTPDLAALPGGGGPARRRLHIGAEHLLQGPRVLPGADDTADGQRDAGAQGLCAGADDLRRRADGVRACTRCR